MVDRRGFLLAATALPLLSSCSLPLVTDKATSNKGSFGKQLAALESQFDGRLSIFSLDTQIGRTIGYREDERFPFCSTFKVLAVSSLLHTHASDDNFLRKRVHYTKSNMVNYSPITEKHMRQGMTVSQLCQAALQYSDNTAANLILQLQGGLAAVNAFARIQLGDAYFRLDRCETALNAAIPGDERDTATPKAMGLDLQQLLLGNVLCARSKAQLKKWMLGNTTGATGIRAGLPASWLVGDKTGSGDYGVANDLAVVWPPKHFPVIISIYTAQNQSNAQPRRDLIVALTEVCAAWVISCHQVQ